MLDDDESPPFTAPSTFARSASHAAQPGRFARSRISARRCLPTRKWPDGTRVEGESSPTAVEVGGVGATTNAEGAGRWSSNDGAGAVGGLPSEPASQDASARSVILLVARWKTAGTRRS